MGTVYNVILILFGGLIGRLLGKYLSPKIEETTLKITGIAIIMLGVSGCLSKMLVMEADGLKTRGEIVILVSLGLGSIVGEIIDFDTKIYKFGMWLKEKSGSKDDSTFVTSFVAATCTVCIGAMAIVGSIEDGIDGNHSILLAKGVSDLIVVAIMSSTQGKGPIFSVIPVIIFQGSISLISHFLGPIIPFYAIHNLSMVGNVLISTVGINITFASKIRVANILPALIVAGLLGGLGFIN
ncbi:MAG: DUF554 domain-containing protein [Peptoniphilaceae bacterium]|nr:DUF554 domain-containing protein [Peptoniphilaceae bacterium]MDY6018810.1 DUF554 domain-containing protein [Anaerococcus sp.]